MAANPYKAMAHAKVSDNFTINSNQFIYVTKTELQEHENMVRFILLLLLFLFYWFCFLEFEFSRLNNFF